MKQFMILSLILLGVAAGARAAGETGYVVRVESNKVYLDYGQASGIASGQSFTIYRAGDELKHPVTGASLGRVEERIAQGVITEIHEKYSLGVINGDASAVAAGAMIRLGDAPPPAAPPPPPAAAPAAPAPAPAASAHEPYFRSPILNLLAVDVAVGDADGDGTQDAVVAAEREIRVYPVNQSRKKWEPLCVHKEETTGAQYLSVEAADLNGDGRAEIFATLHNSFYKRVETQILDCREGALHELKTIPWMVRSYQQPDGRWTLGAQQLVADKTFPQSNIYPLEYHDGRYAVGKERVKYRRLEWLYGFNFARRENPAGEELDPDPFLIFYHRSGKLRAQFGKKAWTSREEYGQTSERLLWHDNKLAFFPRFAVEHGPRGLKGIYTVRNIAPLFNLAAPFGIYRSAELHFLRWNGMALVPEWKTELSGYAAGLAEYGTGADASILIPVRGVESNTSLWFYRK